MYFVIPSIVFCSIFTLMIFSSLSLLNNLFIYESIKLVIAKNITIIPLENCKEIRSKV